MRRLKIGLDMDGVLADTQTTLLEHYNKEYGLSYVLEDIYCWDLNRVQKKGTNMSKYFKGPNFFRLLKPMEDSIEVVELLSADNELFVITASPKEGMMDKVLWVNRYFPCIPEENIIIATGKDLIIGDVLLDDGLHNLANTKFRYPIIYDQPWNRCNKTSFIRVTSWNDFYNIISRIKNGISYEELCLARSYASSCSS